MSGRGGAHSQKAREQYSQDPVERIREREKHVREKDQEIDRLKRKLDTAAKELKTVTDHCKLQSQELYKLKERQANEAALQEEMKSMQESLDRLGQQFTLLEKENEELKNQAQISKTEADLYKEDFLREREDREKAAGRLDSLERFQKERKAQEEEIKRLQKERKSQEEEIKHLRKQEEVLKRLRKEQDETIKRQRKEQEEEVKRWQKERKTQEETVKHQRKEQEEEIKRLQKELSQAKEEAQAKVSQVKQYKKQLDAQEAKANRLEKESHELSLQVANLKKENKKLQHQLEKREERPTKAKDIRAGRKEREATMKEEREKRKNTMSSMDMKSRTTYLEEAIAQLEEDNHCLKTQLESSDTTCVKLASKLFQAEARLNALEKQNDELWSNQKEQELKPSVEETQPMFSQHSREHGSDAVPGYMNVSRKHSKTSQESDYMFIEGSQSHPEQRKQKGHNHTLAPPGAAAKHPHVHRTAPQPRESPVNTMDPALFSKTHEYVNMPPGSEDYVYTSKVDHTQKEAPKRPLATPRSNMQQRRAASMDTEKAVVKRKSSDYASLPEILHSTEEGEDDISTRIDMEIQEKATEVASSTDRDARRNTLKHVPFDPYLKCVYCSRMFRYGEIQKYKRHVLTCTESSS